MDIPSLRQTVSKIDGIKLTIEVMVEGYNHQCELCLLQPSNARELFNLVDANRTYLRQWLPWLDETRSPTDSRAFIEQSQQRLMQNTGLVLAIVTKPATTTAVQEKERGEEIGGAIAGLISLDPIDWHSRTGYIGYWLAEEHQGQGIMTTACQYLINHAFKKLHLNRIVIACATKNKSSRAIPERLGFIYDGRIKQAEWLYEHYVDHEVYVLLNTSD